MILKEISIVKCDFILIYYKHFFSKKSRMSVESLYQWWYLVYFALNDSVFDRFTPPSIIYGPILNAINFSKQESCLVAVKLEVDRAFFEYF